jgi:hypothetical protein
MNDRNQTTNLNEHILHLVRTRHPKTVKQLVEIIHQEQQLTQQEIMEHILNLQNQGKLVFKEDMTPPLTLKTFLLSFNSYWYWGTIILALATTVTVFTLPENAYPLNYMRYLLGSIFILILPGYSLVKALFPTKELDALERIALSIGVSIALVPMVGFILNYTPWGIRLTPITISLLTLTLTLATVGFLREYETFRNKTIT